MYFISDEEMRKNTAMLAKNQQMDLFSAATSYPSSHGGFPSSGTIGTGTGAVSTIIGGNNYTFLSATSVQNMLADIELNIAGNGLPVNTIDDFSFTFSENSIKRRAVLAPEYDMTPLESLKIVRLMFAAPTNLDRLQYVKDQALLRHFRLE
jgi:hypothetical protein